MAACHERPAVLEERVAGAEEVAGDGVVDELVGLRVPDVDIG